MVRVRAVGSAQWSGVSSNNLVEVLRDACFEDSTAPMLVFEDGLTVTRGEMRARVERFAGYLLKRVSRGDRIAVMLGNRTEWMVAWFAAAGCGLTVVSMNPAAQEHDAGHVLRDSGARLIVTDAEHAGLVERLRGQCVALEHVVILRGAEPDGLRDYGDDDVTLDYLAENASAHDVVNVYYTSGTTGPPKGCMVDHVYWLRFVDVFQRLYGLRPTDRMICCLQFFYNDPPWQTLLSLVARTPLVVMRRFSVSRFFDVVHDNDVTVLFGIASTASLLLKAPPSERDRQHRLRFALHVGIPPNLHQELVARWGVPWLEGYGLTETGLSTAMPMEVADAMIGSGSIGRPCPEVEVRVVDDADRDVPEGAPGELAIRAPGMMKGYLNRPDATAETVRDGWLFTGDVARYDSEGFLYFLGRKKDIIRRGGENIAASEVEQVLRSFPDVLDVAVVPTADELRGEEVHAVVLLVDGKDQETTPPAGLIEFCAGRLSKHKVPRYLTYRSQDFPRTPSMRIKKDELRDVVPGWDREGSAGSC
jgi:crotonobetaine/carnitine-CoA ligase